MCDFAQLQSSRELRLASVLKPQYLCFKGDSNPDRDREYNPVDTELPFNACNSHEIYYLRNVVDVTLLMALFVNGFGLLIIPSLRSCLVYGMVGLQIKFVEKAFLYYSSIFLCGAQKL